MKKTMAKIWSMMLVVCMVMSMLTFPVSAEGVTAEIILETTNAVPAEGETVPMGETLMVKVSGAEATGYTWYSKHKNGGTDYRLETSATIVPPSSLTEQYAADAVYCVVEYDGGSITTEAVAIEPYVNSIPYGWDYKNGNNHYKGIPNAENSNAEYTFYVDGKGFVLAKEQNVKGAAYFIVALDAYGDIFTGDDAAKKSSNEWKNYYGQSGYGIDGETTMVTKLLGDGNTFDSLVADSTKTYALPDVFDSYIDMDHNWAYNADKNGSLRHMTAAVALPSYSDYINYQNRIGHIDNLRAEAGKQPVLLRDLYGTASVSDGTNVTGKVISDGLSTSNASGPYVVRPCFWLAKDFFEKNAINLEEAGSGVIAVMTDETYTNQETIKATYLAADMEEQYIKYLAPKSAEIILETTNAAPAEDEIVPLEETLKVSVTGAEATGYQWYAVRGDETTNYALSTEVELVAPANMYEKYGSSTKVFCEVTYDGGTLTTPTVTMEQYVHNIPYGWDYKDGNNHYKGISNAASSDANYVFYVDGKGFVVLKEQNVKDSAYLVMALDAYGDIFSGDNADSKSATEWKNIYGQKGYGVDGTTTMETKLLGEGNTFDSLAEDGDATYALPDAFDSYIDMDHKWQYAKDKWGTVGEFIAGVAIPSYSEYVNYANRLGYTDNLQAVSTSTDVLLRDLYGTSDPTTIGKVISGNLSTSNATGPYLVRPTFWLSKDFFEKNAIDLTQTGRGVIDIINDETYTNQETLVQTYTAAGKLDELELYTQPIAAEIILDTTNAAPAEGELVPLEETLKVSVTGAEATGYQWYAVRGDETMNYALSTESELVAPANMYEKYGSSTKVFCEVTYDGGTLTTPTVTMEQYVHNIPYGWDYKNGNNHYKGVPNAENSDSRYVFYVDGKGFVVAKEQNVKGAAYFVMALDAYGDIFTGDNADAKSQTEWKNIYGQTGFGNDNGTTMVTKLLGEGNTFESLVADSTKTYALPDIFDAYIDADHSWAYAKDKWGTVGAMTSPVAIPSYSDYVNYADRVGHKDNLGAEAGSQPVLLRDLYGTTSPTTMGKVISNGLSTSNEAGPYLVRPCFWLSKDFFEDNAIDLSKAGSGVIDIIKNSVYTDKDVAAQTYADAGMEFEYNIYVNGSFAEGISSSEVVWTDKDGNETTLATATSLKVSFTLANGNEATQPAVVFVAAYGEDDNLLGVNLVNYTGEDEIPAKGSVSVECAIETLTAGTVKKAQVMVWESVTNPIPLLTVNAF